MLLSKKKVALFSYLANERCDWMSRVEKYKKYLPVCVVIIVAISIIYIFVPKKATVSDWEELPMEQSETFTMETTSSSSSAKIVVDIKGEVKKPGVYELESGARVEEIVLLAGGFTDTAEERQLNLAEKLTDQQMIYVPNKEEAKELVISPVANEGNTSTNRLWLILIQQTSQNYKHLPASVLQKHKQLSTIEMKMGSLKQSKN